MHRRILQIGGTGTLALARIFKGWLQSARQSLTEIRAAMVVVEGVLVRLALMGILCHEFLIRDMERHVRLRQSLMAPNLLRIIETVWLAFPVAKELPFAGEGRDDIAVVVSQPRRRLRILDVVNQPVEVGLGIEAVEVLPLISSYANNLHHHRLVEYLKHRS